MNEVLSSLGAAIETGTETVDDSMVSPVEAELPGILQDLSDHAPQGVHEGGLGEPSSGQQRVARSKNHHLSLGERRPHRQDRHQSMAEDPVTKEPPRREAFLVIVHSVNYQYNNPNIHNGMRFR